MKRRLVSAGCIAAMIALSLPAVAAEAGPRLNSDTPSRAPAPAAAAAFISVPAPELVYVSIAPCRAFNTNAAGPRLSTTTRNFFIAGADGFETQGGKSGGCGVPASASAVVVSLTTLGASTSGTIRTKPFGVFAVATAATFTAGQTQTAYATLAIASNRITLATIAGSTNIYADIVGYYAPQIAGYMNANGTVYSGTARILGSRKIAPGEYEIDLDRNVTTCSVFANVDNGPYYANAYPDGSKIKTYTWYLNADAQRVLVDLYHNFVVHC